MLGNAFFAATVVVLAAGFYLIDACRFLAPCRAMLLDDYGGSILAFALALFCNLLAGFFILGRRLFLKDTGKKLAHIEKQLRGRESVLAELTRRIREGE